MGCDKIDLGCSGGLMDSAMNWISQNSLKGPSCNNDEVDYTTYINTKCTQPCRSCPTSCDCRQPCNAADYSVKCSNIKVLGSQPPSKKIPKDQLIEQLQEGPITIAINAN